MKRITVIFLIFILLIACNSNEVSTDVASKLETEEIVMENYEADRYDLAKNVDELFEESDLIIRGTIKTNEQVDLIEESTGRIAYSYFRTNVDVIKVYKGDSKTKNIDDIPTHTRDFSRELVGFLFFPLKPCGGRPVQV